MVCSQIKHRHRKRLLLLLRPMATWWPSASNTFFFNHFSSPQRLALLSHRPPACAMLPTLCRPDLRSS